MTPESRERAHEERALYHDKVSNLLDEVFAEVDRATCAGMEVAMKIPDDITVTVNPTEFACLKAEVNAVLKAFKRRRDKGQYCVNYADLRCVNVSRGIEEDGGLWWLVEMEEGDDHEFCELVRSKLSERWGSVIVRMEW